MGPSRRRVLWVAGAVALAVVMHDAHAANGLRPRTPVVFPNTPCLITVERGAVVPIPYAVPFEDVALTADELPDSRTHQFLAFAHQRFDYRVPRWISGADLERASANGDVTQEFTDNDVLETSAAFPPDSWLRITPDDARAPITFAQAAQGIAWDTADAPLGTWLVAGYTWEPENNLWSFRMGAVRIEDPETAESAGPSAFLAVPESIDVLAGDTVEIPACAVAPPGSTMTLDWGRLVGLVEPTWERAFASRPVPAGEFLIAFDVPREAQNHAVKLRLTITTPDRQRYIAYTPAKLDVMGEAPRDAPSPRSGCAIAPAPRRVRWLGVWVAMIMISRRIRLRSR